MFWLYLLPTTAESPYSVSDNELALLSRNAKSRREKKKPHVLDTVEKYYNHGVPVSAWNERERIVTPADAEKVQ